MREKIFETVGTFGDITIMECNENAPFEDAKFTFSLDTQNSHCYYATLDEAVLGALEKKYLGLNSQFAEFACKMLGILNEAKK